MVSLPPFFGNVLHFRSSAPDTRVAPGDHEMVCRGKSVGEAHCSPVAGGAGQTPAADPDPAFSLSACRPVLPRTSWINGKIRLPVPLGCPPASLGGPSTPTTSHEWRSSGTFSGGRFPKRGWGEGRRRYRWDAHCGGCAGGGVEWEFRVTRSVSEQFFSHNNVE